ncbi:MAG: RluA family pseudouridine synthase [Treponema sp.]|nr:RluA family pseudouridine synthase [Treponema sp.]
MKQQTTKTIHNVKPSTLEKRAHKADYGKEQIKILYQDQDLMVINKPSGLLTVPYPGSKSRTVLSVIENIMRKDGSYSSKHRPFVVHRLDRDTSGVMMLALNEKAQKLIMASWQQMVTERLYHAVAENPKNKDRYLESKGLIDAPLAYNAHNIGFVLKEGDKPSTQRKFRNDGQEKSIYERNLEGYGSNTHFKTVPARTHYKIIFQGETHTLFELSLDTGKKNQIRAHLASKGYPLAGDENYRAKTDPFHRLALHARTLEFIHPFTNEKMRFEVPESESWLKYVQRGDKNPKTPVWNQKAEKEAKKVSVESLNKHIPRKALVHMDFMERMKLKSK